MKKITQLLIFILFAISSNLSFSQTATDSTLAAEALEYKNTEQNFDSLLNEWYVKNAITQDSNLIVSRGLNHFIDVSDSVIIERLNKIETTIPLAFNEDVRKWINMYIKKGEYILPTVLGLSQYYFPLFEQELDANNIPLEIKYLAIVESALNPQAVSPAGATGLWQFMFGTGKMYGLKINTLVDERKDPILATKAAVKMLGELYAIYGDWFLSIAAYNCGPGNVNRALKRAGITNDFWGIYSYLPTETRGYIPAFIAITYLMNYSTEHNFYPIKITLPTYSDTVMVNEKLHLMQVAEVLNIPIDELRNMNPQYKKDLIPGNTQPCHLKLPFETATLFASLSDSIYNYQDSIYIDNVKIAAVTAKYIASTSSSASYSDDADYDPCDAGELAGKTELTYIVKSGDNLGFIANWYDVSTTDLKCWNNTTSTKLNIGDKIIVYVPTKKLPTYKNIDNLTFDQKQTAASDIIVKKSATTSTKLDDTYIYYTIKSGDLISSIAAKYEGVTEAQIKALNSFTDADVRRLQIGQIIKVKKK